MKTNLSRTLVVAGLCLCSGRILASEPLLFEDRFKQIEAQLQTLREENPQLRQQLGVDPKVPAAFACAAGKELKLAVGGYLQAQAEFDDAADNRFTGVPLQTKWAGQDVKLSLGVNGYQSKDTSVSGLSSAATTTDDSFDALGFSVMGGYYVCANIQAIVHYETLNMNRNLAGNSTDEWTFGLNYYIKGDDLKLQFNHLLGNPSAARITRAGSSPGRNLFFNQT